MANDNGKIKLSPKLSELIRWEKVAYVNEMLDSGDSPNQVCKWINKNGFKISVPLIYEYNKIRQNALLNGVSMEKILGVTVAKVKQGENFNDKKAKLKNELEALDKIIDIGYTSLDKLGDRPLPVSILMQAIKLKNDLTEGYFGGLTNYGIEQLQLLEKQKYDVVIELLMGYIPDELKEQATEEIATAEEEFYKHSEYYADYLRASGLTEKEIQIKLKELEEEESMETKEYNEGTLEI